VRVARGSQVLRAANVRWANATGIGWCRRVAGRKLHSRAKIDGSTGVPVRQLRLQKSANDAEVQRSVPTRWQRDTWTGTRTPRFSARSPQGFKSVGRQHRGGQAAELEQAGAGRSKERCGAKVFARWKAPRVVSMAVSFTRAVGGRPRRPPGGFVHARASRTTRGRRQGCQRFGSHASRREDNAHHGDTRGDRATHRSELLCRAADNLSGRAGAKASDAAEADEARVPIRSSEMAEVGPTHRASQRWGAARRTDAAKLAKEHSARRADTPGGGFEVRTVRGWRNTP